MARLAFLMWLVLPSGLVLAAGSGGAAGRMSHGSGSTTSPSATSRNPMVTIRPRSIVSHAFARRFVIPSYIVGGFGYGGLGYGGFGYGGGMGGYNNSGWSTGTGTQAQIRRRAARTFLLRATQHSGRSRRPTAISRRRPPPILRPNFPRAIGRS